MKLYLTTLFLSVAAVSAGRRGRRRRAQSGSLSLDEDNALVSENVVEAS